MRYAVVAGIALIALGAYLFFQGGSITTKEDVVSVGPLQVTASEKRPIAPWVAGLVVLGGVALVVTGARSKA